LLFRDLFNKRGARRQPCLFIAAIQTFGDRINLHPHLHFLVTEGGVDEAGVFHKIPRMDDSRLAAIFAREVLADLVRRELLSPEWAERILSWRHSGFSVHSKVRAKTSVEVCHISEPFELARGFLTRLLLFYVQLDTLHITFYHP
jgi:hypothetical protein